MPNSKSVKKNVRVIKRKTQVNKARKSKIKTFFNKVIQAIKDVNPVKAKEAFKEFESQIMKGVSKGVYKKNTASRKLRKTADKIRKIKGTETPVAKKTTKVAKEVKKAPKTAKVTKAKVSTKKKTESKK